MWGIGDIKEFILCIWTLLQHGTSPIVPNYEIWLEGWFDDASHYTATIRSSQRNQLGGNIDSHYESIISCYTVMVKWQQWWEHEFHLSRMYST